MRARLGLCPVKGVGALEVWGGEWALQTVWSQMAARQQEKCSRLQCVTKSFAIGHFMHIMRYSRMRLL